MPPGAAVVDLCGGSDWLDALTARGWNASSIETNTALHRDARARDANVTLGNPANLLARIADGSLDALTVVAPERIAEDMPLAELLREAHRMLKRGGSLLIGMTPGDSRTPSLSAQTLLAAGFADAKTLDAFGANVVFAVRP
jgi:predicted methyltransferase